jgi:tetratricopeptide (TPR) repeat protein
MDAERWPELNRLFDAAIAREPEERSAFLHEACAGDPALLNRVARLAAAHDAARRIDTGAMAAPPQGTSDAPDTAAIGAPFGAYRAIREIGHGGMGVVYLAVRADDQFDKQVAIKLIKRGIDTDAVLRMFRHERRILAELDHPNITRLLDAGTTAEGRPYFVMEYVDGLPIAEYCRSRALPIRDRLELFRRVCAAAAYAHRHLVVHRDIKPSNILVTADGEPKLLDFGIAKLLDVERGGETTLGAVTPMTPDYASPEQLGGLPVTTLSDVYSLGMVLYELLSGQQPWSGEGGPRAADREPLPPSAVATAAGFGNAPVSRVRRRLKGDLDTIVLMALRAAPDRRYQSVEQLSDDLGRHLTGQPVAARRDAALYRTLKFIRRNALACAAACALLGTLAAGITATRWQALEAHRARDAAERERDRARSAELAATRERDRAVRAEQQATEQRLTAQDQRNRALAASARADEEAATAKAVRDFLQDDLLAQASPNTQAASRNTPDPVLTVRDALDRAAERIGNRFASRPLIEAAIRQTIGVSYKDLGSYAQAEQQLERALALRTKALGPAHVDTLTTMSDLGLVYNRQGRMTVAERLLDQAVAGLRAARGEDDPATLAALNTLASIATNQGRKADVEALLRRILRLQERVLGPDHPDTLGVRHNLATVYVDRGKYADAEPLYEQVVAAKRRVLGPDHPSTQGSLNALAVTHRYLGHYRQAEALLSDVLSARVRTLGPDHLETVLTRNSLALVYAAEHRYGEAERLLTDVVAARHRLLGAEHPQTLASLNNLAQLHQKQGRLAEAETLFAQIVDIRRRTLAPDHPNTISAISSLGQVRLQRGDAAGAEPLLREAVAAYERSHDDSWRRYYAQSVLGASLLRAGRYEEAEPLLDQGYAELVRRRASIPQEDHGVLEEVRQLIAQVDAARKTRSGRSGS